MEPSYVIIPVIALGGLFFLYRNGLPNKAFDTMPQTSLKSSIFNCVAMITMAILYVRLNKRFFNGGGDITELFGTFSVYVDRISSWPELMLLVFVIYVIGVVRALKMQKYVQEANLLTEDPAIEGEQAKTNKYIWPLHAVIYPTTLVFLPAVLVGVVVPAAMFAFTVLLILFTIAAIGWLFKGTGVGISIRHR